MKKHGALLLSLLLILFLAACQRNSSASLDESSKADETHNSPYRELLFEDQRVSIYANDDSDHSVTLVYGEYTHQIEGFNPLRPHCTTWEADADGDGTTELYLIHTIGSGSGVSEDALFVFEPNGDQLKLYQHDSTPIREEFNASCTGVYLPEQQILQLSYGESMYSLMLDDAMYRQYLPTADSTVLIDGQQIRYTPNKNNTIRLSFLLSFSSSEIPSSVSYLPEKTTVSCLIRFSEAGFEIVESLAFEYPSEYPWLAPVIVPMDYEEFFSEERSYYDPGAPWRGYTSSLNALWFDTSSTAYELKSDENGIYICKYGDRKNILHRVPNTDGLTDCEQIITDTWKLYCVWNGDLLCVDVFTGTRTLLYKAEHIPDIILCHNDVLYFLAISDGVLSLNRLYIPTMTLDQLYVQTASDVPANCYRLYEPSSNLSFIEWETISPVFWHSITELLNDPTGDFSNLPFPDAFDLAYITKHPMWTDETVQHNFYVLQEHLKLRPRMKCHFDPLTQTCTETYGIYDICFFGTGIHNDKEHFSSDPTYGSGNT